LVRAYLSNHFGSGSSAIRSYELAIANTNGAFFRAEAEESPFTAEAQGKIDYYINVVDAYDDPYAYIGFLEAEFNTYLSSDLGNPTNLGLALWLAMQTESLDFVVGNIDLLVAASEDSNQRIAHHWWEDVKKWWGENKKCISGVTGSAITVGIAGCGTGFMIGAVKGCVIGAAIGAIGGGLTGYAAFC